LSKKSKKLRVDIIRGRRSFRQGPDCAFHVEYGLFLWFYRWQSGTPIPGGEFF
jgi:hypothetical protein